MQSAKQINMRNKQNAKKVFALIVLVCFIILSLFSEAFILTHDEHEHGHNGFGGSCALCVQLNNVENLLKQLVMAAAVATLGVISLLTTIAILYTVSSLLGLYTPVKLKIRLNN